MDTHHPASFKKKNLLYQSYILNKDQEIDRIIEAEQWLKTIRNEPQQWKKKRWQTRLHNERI